MHICSLFLVSAVVLTLLNVGWSGLSAQERGEEPVPVVEDNAVRDLKQDSAVAPGFDAVDQARARQIRSLDRNAAHRDKRNEISDAGMARLKKDQQTRQDTRNLRSYNPSARRDARRRARVDRRLRARINRR